MSGPSILKGPSLRAAVGEAADPLALAEVFLAEQARLKEAQLQAPQGHRACRTLTELTDLATHGMLCLSLLEDPAVRDGVRRQIAFAATGGYGRRELCSTCG